MLMLTGQAVAIVGGTGSFGSALVARILKDSPNRVVVISRGEHRQAALRAQLGDDRRLRFFIGDVRNTDRLVHAFRSVDVVVNAAALKRIEVCDREREEAKAINVDGMQSVLNAALACGVERVLMISSDKAADPAIFYGTTKQMGEGLTIGWNAYGYPRGQRTCAVRWGNVLGSAGSVLHLFRQKARAGEPLPITDVAMTRFWITMPEAVEFCLSVLTEMRGGEIFVPKMRAASIMQLADVVARVEGMRPEFAHIGVRRGGEKVHECLITEAEAERALDLGWGYVIEPTWNMPESRKRWEGSRVAGAITSLSVDQIKDDELARAVKAVPEEA